MKYTYKYKTPKNFSNMIMLSDGIYLTGLYFEDSVSKLKNIDTYNEQLLPVFLETKNWLDLYFDGKMPNFTPKYKLENSTPFREEVTAEMNLIPFGKTASYKDIAEKIAKKRNIKKMSSQAVGGAVGANPICIIIPCHRVIGSNGKLIGYGGGIKNKIALLELEKKSVNNNTLKNNSKRF